MNLQLEHIFGVAALGILSWGSLQVYNMNAQLVLVSYRVEENAKTLDESYAMLKPMWQRFLRTEPVHAAK
ncbi:MAG: hypothetical protein CMJ25_06075 [Phycisphaerae bacterium]|nr:hypothetical protein [Phycisphaerae bacterium]